MPLERELADCEQYLKGKVLNAGAGARDISHLVEGELVNQDISVGRHTKLDVQAPLHEIPFPDGHFDTIICNAVLEHVENPHEVVDEFARVLRPEGILYLCVPFMQPEHLDPTDFQRYTQDGLAKLVDDHGFDVIQVQGMHSVYTTLAWICSEWLGSVEGPKGWLLGWLILPWLCRKATSSRRHVHSLASANRVIAQRR